MLGTQQNKICWIVRPSLRDRHDVMQMEPAIGVASLAIRAHERAPTAVPRDGFMPGFGFDRLAARRNFERSPYLRAPRLRDRFAPA